MDTVLTTSETIGFLGAVVILALLAVAVRYSWRVGARALATEGRLRFHRVLERLGVELDPVDERAMYTAAAGVRHCLVCRNQVVCDAWLADPSREGSAPPDCPNAPYFRALPRS